MITAVEALTQPTARLTEDDLAAVAALEMEIETHIRKFMERRGCDFQVNEVRGNIIAELNQRIKEAGYIPQWKPIVEQHKLNAALQKHVGYQLSLAPSDAAYREAARSILS